MEEIQRVAQKYVKPDEAALVVVGDGASVLDQIKPYCEDIEVYNTAGRRKTSEASAATDPVWVHGRSRSKHRSDNRFRQRLTISRSDSGHTAMIHSEMGDADLGAIEINNNSFHATTSLEMDGHGVEAEVSARFDGEQVEGTLKLQNSPELPFRGTKD